MNLRVMCKNLNHFVEVLKFSTNFCEKKFSSNIQVNFNREM